MRAGMAGDVGERLLRDAVERGFDVHREALGEAVGVEAGRDPMTLFERLQVRCERGQESVEAGQWWAEALGEPPHRAERLRQELSCLGSLAPEDLQILGQLLLDQPE